MVTAPPKLRGSVGHMGHNDAGDVLLVRQLLNKHLKRDPWQIPLVENNSNSAELEQAIAQFQRLVRAPVPKGSHGRVEPGSSTWRDLVSPPSEFRFESRSACERNEFTVPRTITGLLYPLAQQATASYTEGMRRFNANRDKGTRRHAGIDLYAPLGTVVRAMADGKVLLVRDFYAGTWQITVDHGDFVARYGEVKGNKQNIPVDEEQQVKRGQKLGEVGKLNGMNQTMLHLEIYAKHLDNSIELSHVNGCSPYQRRSDLIDPTPSINAAVFEPFVEEATPATKASSKPAAKGIKP